MARRGYLNVRIDEGLMHEVHEIFSELGISAADAVSIIYNQVKFHHGFPFEVKIPNKETIKAMKEAEHPEKLKSYSNFEEIRKELGV